MVLCTLFLLIARDLYNNVQLNARFRNLLIVLIINTTAKANDTTDILQTFR